MAVSDRYVKYGGISLHRINGGVRDEHEVLRFVFFDAESGERVTLIVRTDDNSMRLEELFEKIRKQVRAHAGEEAAKGMSYSPDWFRKAKQFPCSPLAVADLGESNLAFTGGYAFWNPDTDQAQIRLYGQRPEVLGPKLAMPSSHLVELAGDLAKFFLSRHVYFPDPTWSGLEFLKEKEPVVEDYAVYRPLKLEVDYIGLLEIEMRVVMGFWITESKVYRDGEKFRTERERRELIHFAATHAEASFIATQLQTARGLDSELMMIGPAGQRTVDVESLDPAILNFVQLTPGCIQRGAFEVLMSLSSESDDRPKQIALLPKDAARLLFDLYELLRP